MSNQKRFRRRRGATTLLVLTGMVALVGFGAVAVDGGRLYMAKQAAQNAADAGAFAGGRDLPYKDKARTSANRACSGNGFAGPAVVFYPDDSALATQIEVRCETNVALLFGVLIGQGQSRVSGMARVSRMPPANKLQGAVPWGVQQADFQLGQQVVLKLAPNDQNIVPGNFQALDLNGSGANDYSNWLKWGYDGTLTVGQEVLSETGMMSGPTDAALVSDLDSRFQRAAIAPWSDDTWSSFDSGNPRILTLPIINWYVAAKDGKTIITILGFAAFYVENYDHNGTITGRFVTYTDPHASIDPTLDPGYDGGLAPARLDT